MLQFICLVFPLSLYLPLAWQGCCFSKTEKLCVRGNPLPVTQRCRCVCVCSGTISPEHWPSHQRYLIHKHTCTHLQKLFWINGPNCQLRLDWLCLFNDRVFNSARLSSVIDLTAIRCYFTDYEWLPWPWSWILKSYRLTGSGYDVIVRDRFSKTLAASVQIDLTAQTLSLGCSDAFW